jgi:integrase
MPKIVSELSAQDVKLLVHDGSRFNANFPVGGVTGLKLQITPTNARSWLLIATVGAKVREIGLGAYPSVTLSQARTLAREMRDKIRRGIDPVEERKAAKAALFAAQKRGLTFDAAVEKYLEQKLKELTNDKHGKQWRSTLVRYASPAIGKMLVSEITVHDVQRMLDPIWMTITETATRVRSRVESVLDWATVKGHLTGENPARWKGNLETLMPKPNKVAKKSNQPAVALKDAQRWFAALQMREGVSARALEFVALTAARSGEVRGAVWNEFDLVEKIWTVPAERMKADKEHRVTLTDEAVALLNQMPRLNSSPYVFAAPREGQLSDMALSQVMRRMHADDVEQGGLGFVDNTSKRPAVPHGLRSTFRVWAAEKTDYPSNMAEHALAHAVGNAVERAYLRSDMVEKRRGMMEAWDRFLRGSGTKETKN